MPAAKRTVVRRLALLLITVQLAGVTLAPALEALLERGSVPASIEAAHQHCTVVHQPATCPACALAAVRALPPERLHLALTVREAVAPDGTAPAGNTTRAPLDIVRSRAPPFPAS
jgi:hypothetical protein